MMKFLMILFTTLLLKSVLIAQSSVSIPGEYFQMFRSYPLSNDHISFTLPNTFPGLENYVLDESCTYQYLITLPLVSDSLLSECIKYAMLSLTFEPAYKKKGIELWYGLTNNKLNIDQTIAGAYYQNFTDSTKVWVLTTFSLSYTEKKKSTNTSKYICESIKNILDKYRKRK